MKIHSLAEANQILSRYRPTDLETAYTLDRMQALMQQLDEPQHKYKVIHVAGTAGKTSTSYFLAALLAQAGQKVGLTVSPHLDDVNDRVQLNGAPLREELFCKYLSQFLGLEPVREIKPTYFELLVAFAFWVFAQQQVDYAVIEVGLGGLLDGTNVIDRDDKVCLITDIGLDHTRILGHDLPSIAAQKAGIIQPHNHVFMLQQPEEVIATVSQTAQKQGAALQIDDPAKVADIPISLPTYQRRNWALAKTTFDYVAQRDVLPILTPPELNKTAIQVPGRLEVKEIHNETIVFDGAHNTAKFEALVNSLSSVVGDEPLTVVLGMVEAKEAQLKDCLKLLQPLTRRLICTGFPANQDLFHTAIPPEQIAAAAQELGFRDVEVEADAQDAFSRALYHNRGPVLVTGSLYLLAYLRKAQRP